MGGRIQLVFTLDDGVEMGAATRDRLQHEEEDRQRRQEEDKRRQAKDMALKKEEEEAKERERAAREAQAKAQADEKRAEADKCVLRVRMMGDENGPVHETNTYLSYQVREVAVQIAQELGMAQELKTKRLILLSKDGDLPGGSTLQTCGIRTNDDIFYFIEG